jgi:hypothetical protein
MIHGSHGAPAVDAGQRSVLISSRPGMLPDGPLRDVDVFGVLAAHFGLNPA